MFQPTALIEKGLPCYHGDRCPKKILKPPWPFFRKCFWKKVLGCATVQMERFFVGEAGIKNDFSVGDIASVL